MREFKVFLDLIGKIDYNKLKTYWIELSIPEIPHADKPMRTSVTFHKEKKMHSFKNKIKKMVKHLVMLWR